MDRASISLLFLIFLTSCGYHMGTGGIFNNNSSISVPFVGGDRSGVMTSELVNAISSTGTLHYKNFGGDFQLLVTLLDYRDENIGYQYDRKKKRRTNTLISTETRRWVSADVELVDSCGEVVFGPARVVAHYDFDHDFYSSVNVFSLGQLTDIDAAGDAITAPLYRELAKKIINMIINVW